MKIYARIIFAIMGLTIAGCGGELTTAPPSVPGRAGVADANTPVVPVRSQVLGRTYGEWSAAWWQWAFSLPVTGHPLFDATGEDAGRGQSGPVWFLGGVFSESGAATREIMIPPGKFLFFPILNVEVSNVLPPISPPLSESELRAFAASYMDLATDMACDLDGEPIEILSDHRATSPPFDVTLPDDNLAQFLGLTAPPGTYGPFYADGVYLMLKPLPAGRHTLHFTGRIDIPPAGAGTEDFTLDIHYGIQVGTAGTHAIEPI